jgi:hypothetical protein
MSISCRLISIFLLCFHFTQTIAIDGELRIVGGSQITDPSRYPYLAYSSGIPSCGATLIWSDILLTAGHCDDAFVNQGVRIGGIQAAALDGEFHAVEQVLVHPDYPDASTQPNDIMLVKLSTFSSIQPVPIATSIDQPEFNSTVKILGFGLTADNGDLSPYAKEVDVTVVNFTACDDLYGGKLEDVQFCTESKNGDSCQGDSGGPLLDQYGIQVGIVAFGEGCFQYPSVNTRVSSFSTWIQQGICELSSSPPESCLYPAPTQQVVVPIPTTTPTTIPPTWAPTNFPTTAAPIYTPAPTLIPSLSQQSISTTTSVPTVAVITIAPTIKMPSNIPSLVPSVTNIPQVTNSTINATVTMGAVNSTAIQSIEEDTTSGTNTTSNAAKTDGDATSSTTLSTTPSIRFYRMMVILTISSVNMVIW